ncbi:GntR family transcriptional regulator [Ruminococcus sp. CLA-AA-H200]|uniref:GntR family transcriptional regulator n=1 Tax=Ruminococcus turbiniformis TaxID=2881258 RepID=A0ABS8FWG4_9FIRM|nr:GntR family transcriptional regulator [Ruminococcus turbiniformis]MCC2254382.1 GntR family transcriptional regulator [Ruminococcus turbiniformis]
MPLPNQEFVLERTSAKQRVYDTVKDWIIEGQFKPGEKILDNEIADYFKISRTPVREAFQMLESQKLIKSYPGKATIVTELETDNIEELYLPMAMLQQLAIRLAIEKITPAHIRRLRTLSEAFSEAVKEQSRPMPILKADKEFHRCILEVAENEYIMDFCDVLWIHIQRLEYSFFRDTPLDGSIREHESMIQALQMKDDYSASILAKEHWDRTALLIRELNRKS